VPEVAQPSSHQQDPFDDANVKQGGKNGQAKKRQFNESPGAEILCRRRKELLKSRKPKAQL
jgi:hypothetical protein